MMSDNTYMCAPVAKSKDPERQSRIDQIHGKTVRVARGLYTIHVLRIYGYDTVVLVGRGDADPAYSGTDFTDYGYTHGGKRYRDACIVADDLNRWIGGYDINEINSSRYTQKFFAGMM